MEKLKQQGFDVERAVDLFERVLKRVHLCAFIHQKENYRDI